MTQTNATDIYLITHSLKSNDERIHNINIITIPSLPFDVYETDSDQEDLCGC